MQTRKYIKIKKLWFGLKMDFVKYKNELAEDKGLKEAQRMDCRFIFVLKGHYIEIKL